MPRYVIHVGPHKTGTTYLQIRFRHLRDDMLARGIVYPAIWEMAARSPGQRPLVDLLRAGDMAALAPEFAALNASGARIVLISAEDLSNSDEAALRLLKTLTAGNGVEVVFALRRWSGLIPSVWQENVKQGHTATLPQFLLGHVMKPAGSRLLNVDMKLAPLAAIFGRDALRLVCYDLVRESGADLFTHFAATFLDWPDAPPDTAAVGANASLDPVQAELIRVLNALHQEQGGARNAELRSRFRANARRIDMSVPQAAIARHMVQLRFGDDSTVLRPLHRSLSDQYLPLVVPPKLETRLFRPTVQVLTHASPDYLLAAGVMPAIQAAYGILFP